MLIESRHGDIKVTFTTKSGKKSFTWSTVNMSHFRKLKKEPESDETTFPRLLWSFRV